MKRFWPLQVAIRIDVSGAICMAAKLTSRQREEAVKLRPVVDPVAWTVADLTADQSWMHPLTATDIAELDALVAKLEPRISDVLEIKREDIDLPTLGPRLEAIGDDIINGRGLALIRGVPAARYTRLGWGSRSRGTTRSPITPRGAR